tara:strand:- start:104 stop:643 length:540 start_codon:yes stop_codon:yes gene_type:complete
MKGLDNLIQEVKLGDTGYTESQYNAFDAPVPGESLTNTPGNAAWEHPPTYAKPEDAIEFINDRMSNEVHGKRALMLMSIGIPIEALVKIITFSGFLNGKWTVDTAKILEPLVAMLLAKMAKDAQIDNIRIDIGDPKDSEFMEDATLQEMAMKQDEMGIQEPMPELPAQEGLMARPDIGV